MKFGVVKKSTTVNRFVLHTLQRNITHLAVIIRKTNINLGILKGGGGTGKEPKFVHAMWNILSEKIETLNVKILLTETFVAYSIEVKNGLFFSPTF